MKLFGLQIPAVLTPIEQALRSAAEKLRQLPAREREQLKKDDAQRKQHTEAQIGDLKQKLAQLETRLLQARDSQLPSEQLRQHVELLKTQLRSLEVQARSRPRVDGVRTSGNDVVPQLRERLRDAEEKIQAARDRGLPEVVVSRLEIQAAALEQVLAHAEAHQTPPGVPVPKTLQLAPGVMAKLLSLAELKERIAQVKAALEQMGTGFELTSEPGKLQEAESLRHELLALTQAFGEAASKNFASVSKHEGLSAEQLAQVTSGELGSTQAAVAPEVKAFVASYYGDQAEFKPQPMGEQNTEAATPKTATKVASDFTKGFLGLPIDDPFFEDKREKWLSMAAGFLVQTGGDAGAARVAMERALLKSEDGFFPVLRDLRFGFREALRQGAIGQETFDKVENLLKRLGQPIMTSWISNLVDKNPTATKNDVVKELFLELTRVLQHHEGPLTPATSMKVESARAISGKHVVSG